MPSWPGEEGDREASHGNRQGKVGKPQDATTVLEALRSLAQEQEVPEP